MVVCWVLFAEAEQISLREQGHELGENTLRLIAYRAAGFGLRVLEEYSGYLGQSQESGGWTTGNREQLLLRTHPLAGKRKS